MLEILLLLSVGIETLPWPRETLPPPAPRVKTCLCSERCVCGCNSGQECACQSRQIPTNTGNAGVPVFAGAPRGLGAYTPAPVFAPSYVPMYAPAPSFGGFSGGFAAPAMGGAACPT